VIACRDDGLLVAAGCDDVDGGACDVCCAVDDVGCDIVVAAVNF
jgi:hypothetical protein